MKKTTPTLIVGIAAALSFSLSATSAQSLRPQLDASNAEKIVEGCKKLANKEDWRMAIAVYDHNAILAAYLRMDNVKLGNVEIAIKKGESAAHFGRPTKWWADKAEDNAAFIAMPAFPAFEGGEPIYSSEGVLLGGVGVSGSSGENDAICARRGIEHAGLVTDKR